MLTASDSQMLHGFWYLAVAAKALATGNTVPLTIAGEDILVVRDHSKEVYAYSDRCPHRGMPLKHAKFDGKQLQCCYHGWTFNASDGICSRIPALSPEDLTPPSKFQLKRFECTESQGNIWIYIPTRDGAHNRPPPVPEVPGFADVAPNVSVTMRFPCNVDVASMGFCDPAHPSFVHTSRWWKSKSALSLRVKSKTFEPIPFGFRMKQHQLTRGANPYRLLGSDVSINVTVQLPGVRVEHIHGSRHSACVLAAATPVTASETDVHYCVYWSVPWLSPLRPLATWMARDFLRQDCDIAGKLASNDETPNMLFVGDPDVQVAWLLRLKREYLSSEADGREFVNPLSEKTLHWRS